MLKQKDVPQSISGRDELHKDELHNVVVVMEAQTSLRQRRTQAEGERRRTIGFKHAGLCNFRFLVYNDNNIDFSKITDVNIN